MKKKLKDMVVGDEFLIEHTKQFKIKTVVDYVSKKYLVVMQERNPILFHLGVCGSEEYEMIEPGLEVLYQWKTYIKRVNGGIHLEEINYLPEGQVQKTHPALFAIKTGKKMDAKTYLEVK